MKEVIQLDHEGYFIGFTVADESPLEPGVYLYPAGTIDAPDPQPPENHTARWVDGAWLYEEIKLPEPEPEPPPWSPTTYEEKRMNEYPNFREYLDGVVKGDQAQIDKYIADCLAVKAKYPKPEA